MLQNQEGTYSQAISNRMTSAVPNKVEAISAPASFAEESVLYLDAEATVEFTPSGQPTTVTMSFAAGWVPVRMSAVTSVSAGNAYRAY